MKKIALIGTHGTGKTVIAHSLVAELRKRGQNAGYLGEIARECPLPINEGTTKNAQKWIILNQCSKEIELEEKYNYLICDRSALDSYVYYYRKFGKSQGLEPLILEHIKTYSYLFKTPINSQYLIKDGTRSISIKFQKEIDDLFKQILIDFHIPYYNYSDLDNTIKIISDV